MLGFGVKLKAKGGSISRFWRGFLEAVDPDLDGRQTQF